MKLGVAMAVCVNTNSSGVLVVNPTPVGECQAYILLDSTDWVGSSVWKFPAPEEVGQYFSAGFALPFFSYVIAFGVGQVLKMFSSR